jgi:hypothetical protein
MNEEPKSEKDPKWKRFEKLAYEIQKEFAGTAQVTLNDSIPGIDSKTKRQIDISIREQIGQYPILVVIDCKDYKEPVDVKAIEEFSTMVRDVRANKSAIVSSNGFTEAALNVAKTYGIDTFRLVDTESVDWKTYAAIPVLLERTFVRGFQMQFSGTGYVLIPSSTQELAELELQTAEGTKLGSTKNILHAMWNKEEIKHEPGVHYVTVGTEVFAEYRGVRSKLNVSASVHVKREYYVGPLPIHTKGFKDEQKDALIIRTVTTDAIEPKLIERGEVPGWEKIDDPDKLSIRIVMKLAYSDAYGDNEEPALSEAKPEVETNVSEPEPENTHSLVELGLTLNSVKAKIFDLLEREKIATDNEERTRLRRERESLQNKEAALIITMRQLQGQRHGSH